MKRTRRERNAIKRVSRDTALGYQIAADIGLLGIVVLPVKPDDGEVCHLDGNQCEIVVRREITTGPHGSKVIDLRVEFAEYETEDDLSDVVLEKAKKRICSLVRSFQLRDVRRLEKRLGVQIEVSEKYGDVGEWKMRGHHDTDLYSGVLQDDSLEPGGGGQLRDPRLNKLHWAALQSQ